MVIPGYTLHNPRSNSQDREVLCCSCIWKTDYLTACSQAERFLAEESYKWYKNGLNEDGAINLEAPREWRHLREKTGHGAFYGMRIIIYE
ncbi:hypothetical protein ACB098_10G073000 [Castanea mollissima]